MILKLVRILICSCLIYSGSGFAESSEQETLMIGMINDLAIHQRSMMFLKQAYKEAGLKVSFVYMPSRRSLHDANRGHLDGDAGRISGADALYPNLIRVPTPMFNSEAFVFVINKIPEIQSWEDLKPYQVGIVRGIIFSERGTVGLNPIRANSYEQLFSLLVSGRIDIAISMLDNGQAMIARSFPESGIHPQQTPIYTGSLYHFLHKKHQHLIPLLDDAFQKIHGRDK